MRVIKAAFALATIIGCALVLNGASARGQDAQSKAPSKTKVVLLGTGNPGPDPDRSGPATAIVVNGTAYRVDIETRTNPDGNQRAFPEGHNVNAHEISAGVIYKDSNVTVTAFPTKHAMESYGYRFDTPDRSIVISGDTNPTQATVDACHGCDVLIHEAETPAWLATRPETFQRFAAKYHTTTPELAELASKAKPRLLILYHYNGLSNEELVADMLAHYSKPFVVGRDLDVY